MTEALTFLCADVFQHTHWFMYTLQGSRGQKGNRGETVSFRCLLSYLSLVFFPFVYIKSAKSRVDCRILAKNMFFSLWTGSSRSKGMFAQHRLSLLLQWILILLWWLEWQKVNIKIMFSSLLGISWTSWTTWTSSKFFFPQRLTKYYFPACMTHASLMPNACFLFPLGSSRCPSVICKTCCTCWFHYTRYVLEDTMSLIKFKLGVFLM